MKNANPHIWKSPLSLSTLLLLLVCSLSSSYSQGWRKLYLPVVDSSAKIIQFVDSLNGWILAEKQVFVTSDGGLNWLRHPSPSASIILDGKYLNNGKANIITSENKEKTYLRIYETSDFGRSWKLIYKYQDDIILFSDTSPSRDYAVSFREGQSIIVFAANYRLFTPHVWRIDLVSQTSDSVLLPKGYPFPIGNWAYCDMDFKDSLTGYITAGQGLGPGMLPWGLILKTTDGGHTWRDDTVMYRAMFERVEFTDAQRGYICGYQDFVYDEFRGLWTSVRKLRYTVDAGKTWKTVFHNKILRGYFLNDSLFLHVVYRNNRKYPFGYFGITNLHKEYSGELLINDSLIVDCAYVAPDHKWALRYDGRTVYKWDPLLSSEEHISEVKSMPLPKLYPNPATDRTQIDFTLPEEATVVISLHDLFGRRIKVITDRSFDVGSHSLEVNCRDLPSGVYLCDVQITTEKRVTKRNWLKLSIFGR